MLRDAFRWDGALSCSGLELKDSQPHSHTAFMMAGPKREGAAPLDV